MKWLFVATMAFGGGFVMAASAPEVTVRSMMITAAAYSDLAPACKDNLCGMESHCSCHQVGGQRCWNTQADCTFDAKCCWTAGNCHGQGKDECAKKTIAARKKKPR